ncbi:Uncharacterized protein DAT39_017447 [Clarias magur]|uniref:Uncharacterized protein n=1 Tax=Clarias magur TaxID=1594786 RepID=A0A8J4TRL2_CLAMG|nr:Uncharacterized protein DAT39_017447 [Clarias magur]
MNRDYSIWKGFLLSGFFVLDYKCGVCGAVVRMYSRGYVQMIPIDRGWPEDSSVTQSQAVSSPEICMEGEKFEENLSPTQIPCSVLSRNFHVQFFNKMSKNETRCSLVTCSSRADRTQSNMARACAEHIPRL